MITLIKLTFEKSTWYANGIETRFGTYAKVADVISETLRLNPGATVSI